MARNILRGFLSIIGTKVGVLLVSVLTTPFIVRLLGSSNYGDYALVMSVFSVLAVFTQSGIFNGIRKYIAEGRGPHWEEHVLGFYLRVSLLVSGVFATALVVASRSAVIDELLAPEFQLYFTLLAVYLFVSQFYPVGRGVLMALGREHYSEPLRIVKKVVFAVVAILLLYYGNGVVGLLASHILSTSVVGIVAFWLIKDRLSTRLIFSSIKGEISRRQLLSFNIYSILLAFLTISLYNVDILILRLLTGSEETGFYKAALVVAEFMWFVPTAIQYTLVHSTSEMWANNQRDKITQLASRATRMNLSLVVIMSIGLIALVEIFVPIYFGSEFSPATGPLLLLLPGVLGFGLARPIFAIGQGKGELRSLVLATGLASGLNLCLNLLLIPKYGMYGAAVSTSIGYGSMLIFHTWSAIQIGFNPLADLRLGRILAAGIPSALVIFSLTRILPGFAALFIVPPIGFLVYAITSMNLGVVDDTEMKRIQERAPRKLSSLINLLRTFTR